MKDQYFRYYSIHRTEIFHNECKNNFGRKTPRSILVTKIIATECIIVALSDGFRIE